MLSPIIRPINSTIGSIDRLSDTDRAFFSVAYSGKVLAYNSSRADYLKTYVITHNKCNEIERELKRDRDYWRTLAFATI